MFRTNATHDSSGIDQTVCHHRGRSVQLSRLTVSVSHSQLLSTGVPIVYRTYVACIMCVCVLGRHRCCAGRPLLWAAWGG